MYMLLDSEITLLGIYSEEIIKKVKQKFSYNYVYCTTVCKMKNLKNNSDV